MHVKTVESPRQFLNNTKFLEKRKRKRYVMHLAQKDVHGADENKFLTREIRL